MEKVPAGHALQIESSFASAPIFELKYPVAHIIHRACNVSLFPCHPAGQTLHDAALPPGEKNPMAHSKQPVATSPYWPAAHPAQLVAFIVNAVVHSKHRTDGFRELLK